MTDQTVRISRAIGGWDFHVPVDVLPGYPNKGFILAGDAEDHYLDPWACPGFWETVTAVDALDRIRVIDVFHDFPDGTSRLRVSVSHVVDGTELRLRVAEVIRDRLGLSPCEIRKGEKTT